MAQSSNGSKDDMIDIKYPTWDGSWDKWQEYQLIRVELRADGMKEAERNLLGPRLAANLSMRAFDSIAEIDREQLRKSDGRQYLLKYLADTRGKEKVDLLGDAFQEFFVKKEIYRKDQEEFNDHEHRFRTLVRKWEKALKESGASGTVPSKIFGRHLLNLYMKMDPSDVANVRGRAESYKMEHVIAALQKMSSGGGLSAKDLELKQRRKNNNSSTMHIDDDAAEEEVYLGADDEEEEIQVLEMSEAAAWDQEALNNFLQDPEDKTVLATFKEARKALDQAKTARGFYPTNNPNAGNGRFNSGMRKGGNSSTSFNPDAHKDCMRCGKRGHIARNCPQRPFPRKGNGKGKVSFAQEHEVFDANCGFVGHLWQEAEEHVMTVEQDNPFHLGYGILDSGDSDNVIGVDTLQDLAAHYEQLGFDPVVEFEVNRTTHKNFIYGSDHSSRSLGVVHLTVGILGIQMILDIHIVDGGTPLLLSAKWLYDMRAHVDFRAGEALFETLSDKKEKRTHGPGNHLMLSFPSFGGEAHVREAIDSDSTADDAQRPTEDGVQKGESLE